MKYVPIILENCESYHFIYNQNTDGKCKELTCDVT